MVSHYSRYNPKAYSSKMHEEKNKDIPPMVPEFFSESYNLMTQGLGISQPKPEPIKHAKLRQPSSDMSPNVTNKNGNWVYAIIVITGLVLLVK